MKGTVRSYLPAKRYGFIRGDDGRDYFFHASAFKGLADGVDVLDGALVEFTEQATPKGYRATGCTFIEATGDDLYEVPGQFLASKSGEVRGWEVMDRASWRVHGSSRRSPDAARRDAEAAAKRIGANGLLELHYYKSTGSEAGTGKGTHYFTVHHFRGRPVILARRHEDGSKRAAELAGLDQRAKALKAALVAETESSQAGAVVCWVIAALIALAALASHPGVLVVSALLVILFGQPTNHDDWLQPDP